MQVLPCSKRFCHDWTVCPYAHPGEKAKRRDPRVHSYTGIACPNMKKVRHLMPCCPLLAGSKMGFCLPVPAVYWFCEPLCMRAGSIVDMSLQDQACVRGDSCPYAHNVFEYWLHPTRYRTQLCNDMEKCNRKVSASSSPLLFAILHHSWRYINPGMAEHHHSMQHAWLLACMLGFNAVVQGGPLQAECS